MKRELALRYLLLHHLKGAEHRVPPEAFEELTRSLQVSRDSDGYAVQWRRGGQSETRRFREADFSFYQRGDIDAASRTVEEDLTTNNDATARLFALEAFGLPSIEPDPFAAPRVRIAWTGLAGHGSAILLLVVIRQLGLASGAIVFLIGLLEYFRFGRFYASTLFVLLAIVSPGAAIAGAAAYAALQFLDPDARGRTARVAVSLAASAVGLVMKATQGSPFFGAGALVLAGIFTAAFLIAASRSLVYSHQRAFCLALPFVWAGFALDGGATLAIAGLGLSAAGVLWTTYASRMNRPQRAKPRAHTPVTIPVTIHTRS